MKKIALLSAAAIALMLGAPAAYAFPGNDHGVGNPHNNDDDCGCLTIEQIAVLDAPVLAVSAGAGLFVKNLTVEATAAGIAQSIDVKDVNLSDFSAKQDATIDAPVTAISLGGGIAVKNITVSSQAVGAQQTFKGVNLY